MPKILAAAFPGVWLSLWHYGVLLVAWFVLIRPSRYFLSPFDNGGAGAWGYLFLAVLAGAVFTVIGLVDGVLYARTIPGGVERRDTIAVLIGIVGGITLTVVWGGAFFYGMDSAITPLRRWSWIIVYGFTICLLLVAHFHVIWRFRDRTSG